MFLADHTAPRRDTLVAALGRHSLILSVVACLLAFAAANISLRASWHEVEDGVLWVQRPDGVTAAEVATLGAAHKAGLAKDDLLLAIDGAPVDRPDQVLEALHGARPGQQVAFTILRGESKQILSLILQPVPEGNRALYFVQAAVAIFTLFVGGLVRLRRPQDPATLHFFWLSVAFFGVFAFSFSGRLDRLDWAFYWADVIAVLLLPPLFVHFALVFPDRPAAFVRTPWGFRCLALIYAPAAVLGLSRAVAMARPGGPVWLTPVLQTLDKLEHLYLGAGLVGGLVVMLRAIRRVRSITARRQLRWIVWGTALGALPFVTAYVLPFVLGGTPWPRTEWLVLPLGLVPLAFASAVVRYRLMDVEVIIKRGVVYATAFSAITAIYAVLLKLATEVLFGGTSEHNTVLAVLATLVVVLLAPMVKNAVQTAMDRAHYRDRYDYRRALVGFARDLNSDLDLDRLSARLVDRVRETLALDKMALLIASTSGAPEWVPVHSSGFDDARCDRLLQESGVGGRLLAGHAVMLDDPFAARRFTADEVAYWRTRDVHALVPCVSSERTNAVMMLGARSSGEPLSSEDLSLLSAVAGQVATALENGWLYQQLRVKADELDRLRDFSESIIASLNDGLLVAGLNERILRWNPALESLYGVSRADALGQPIDRLFDASFLEALRASRQQHGGAEAALYRVPFRSRHQEPRALLLNVAVAPLRTPDGGVAGAIMIFEDTTARVKLEEQLQISDKMASLGLLAAGVAHEVNTPLTGISSYAQMLLDGADDADPRTAMLKKIERQTFRAAKIVNGLLNLARPASVDAGPVDVHAVINDVFSLIEHQLKARSVQVRKEFGAGNAHVSGVEHKLQQVFLNLFLNARDAMPKGGWLSVSTAVEGPALRVVVGDTGGGIPNEHLSRIYDPFFTTKPIGEGTGLGLSITYGIVQDHNGAIACESAPGQGTRFILSLPLASTTSAFAEPASR